MLETIREFGLEQLAAGEDADATWQRHAGFYLALTEEAEPALWDGAGQVAWLDRLERERANLRAALTWAIDHDLETAPRLGAALGRFWLTRGPLSEGQSWTERLLTAGGERMNPTIRASLLYGAAVLVMNRGDYASANLLLTEGLVRTRASDDTHGTARMLHAFGNVKSAEGDVERANEQWEQALAFYRQVGDAWGEFAMHNNLGEGARIRGHVARATRLYEEAQIVAERLHDEIGLTLVLLNHGLMDLARGEIAAARGRLTSGLSDSVRLGDVSLIAFALSGLAPVAERLHQPLAAARLLGAMAAHCERAGLALQPLEQALNDQTEAALRQQLNASTAPTPSTRAWRSPWRRPSPKPWP